MEKQITFNEEKIPSSSWTWCWSLSSRSSSAGSTRSSSQGLWPRSLERCMMEQWLALLPHQGPGLVTLWVLGWWLCGSRRVVPDSWGRLGKKTRVPCRYIVAHGGTAAWTPFTFELQPNLTIKMAHKWNVQELKRFAQICTHTGISNQTCQQCSGSLTNDTSNILHCFFASVSPHSGATHIKLGYVNQWLSCTLALYNSTRLFTISRSKKLQSSLKQTPTTPYLMAKFMCEQNFRELSRLLSGRRKSVSV